MREHKIGDTVRLNGLSEHWFHGTIVEVLPSSVLVRFGDGDECSCVKHLLSWDKSISAWV